MDIIMKILCLADLHINRSMIKYLQRQIKDADYDIVLIAGDIFESTYADQINPYKQLAKIFPDTLVLCVLGNHEFWYHSPKEIKEKYSSQYNPEKYNVHYLDIINYYDYQGYRFVGNFLGYDGTINPEYNKFPDKFIGWNDSTIKDWNNYRWKSYCKRCQQRIIKNMSKDIPNILLTHTTPHKRLNLHKYSKFNIYSGISDFLEKNKFSWAICGHTHLRSIGLVINDCNCINVGSDYYKLNYEIIEL